MLLPCPGAHCEIAVFTFTAFDLHADALRIPPVRAVLVDCVRVCLCELLAVDEQRYASAIALLHCPLWGCTELHEPLGPRAYKSVEGTLLERYTRFDLLGSRESPLLA